MLMVKAEVRYVGKLNVTLETFAENSHLADSLKLPMLKKMVMEFIVGKSNQILGSSNLPQSKNMLRDILTVIAAKEQATRDAIASVRSAEKDLRLLPVSTLRRTLNTKGLRVDGTREMLIAALGRVNES